MIENCLAACCACKLSYILKDEQKLNNENKAALIFLASMVIFNRCS